jgi:hypothetical protein
MRGSTLPSGSFTLIIAFLVFLSSLSLKNKHGPLGQRDYHAYPVKNFFLQKTVI